MIEVFKTDVEDWRQAANLVEEIHSVFHDYTANFDLEDCDRILSCQMRIGIGAAVLPHRSAQACRF